MKSRGGVDGEGAEELMGQLGIIGADLVAGRWDIPLQKGAVAEINDHMGQGFLHGDEGGAITPNALLVADGLAEGLSEADADILHGMVPVHLEVAPGFYLKINKAVTCKEVEHVLEKRNTDGSGVIAGAVNVERDADLSFLCGAFHNGGALGSHGITSKQCEIVWNKLEGS